MVQFIEQTAVMTLQFILDAQKDTDLKALPNEIWGKVLDRCVVSDDTENNGLIDTSLLETEVENLALFGQRPPKGAGVGSSTDTPLKKKVRGKVQAIFQVYASELAVEGVEGRVYFRSNKTAEVVTPEDKPAEDVIPASNPLSLAEDVIETPEAEDTPEEVTS